MLATVQVPEHNGPVITATGEPAAIGTLLECLHRPLMRLLHPHAVQAWDLPPAQPAVTASTHQHLPTRTPGHRIDQPRMPHQISHTLPAVRLPHKELPALSAATTRGHPHPIATTG